MSFVSWSVVDKFGRNANCSSLISQQRIYEDVEIAFVDFGYRKEECNRSIFSA